MKFVSPRSWLKDQPEFLKLIMLIISAFILSVTLEAQDSIPRPSIGLVLSGGGAHGIAHLGIIKVMEEAGLRPDYITGVSMGSIIGGFYAMGYSADTLLTLFRGLDWTNMLSNRIPENRFIFLEKEQVNNSVLALPLTKNKIIIPSGLINGQVIENTLNYHAYPAAEINDFSKLPIPFSCLAADIVTYRKIEFKKGYLPDAIRASFSVPSIFTPLKIDTLLLLDGGLIRNFAASEAKNMGADIIIGSYVGFEANGVESLQTVPGIIEQIAMYRSLEDFREQSKLADYLISPEVDDLPITGFENVDTLFMRGYKAAVPFRERFRRLADSLNLISVQKPLENILNRTSLQFDRIEIEGNKNYSDNQILGVLDIEPGSFTDRHTLGDRIELLYGKAWFDKVKYRVEPRNDSLILIIDCIEKPEAMLYGSVHYDNSLSFGLKIGFSVKNIIAQRSVININSFIARYYRIRADLTQYIDINQKYALSAGMYADKSMIPSMVLNGDAGQVLLRLFMPGFTLSKRVGLNNMMSLNMNFEKSDLIVDYESDVNLKSITNNYLSGGFKYQANTLDQKHFPNKGTTLTVMASTSKLMSGYEKTEFSKEEYDKPGSNFAPVRFYTAKGSVLHYFSPSHKFTLGFGGDILYMTSSDTLSEQNSFYGLGGIESINERSISMVGFHPFELQVRLASGLKTEMDIELIRDLHLSVMADFFVAREAFSESDYVGMAGLGLGAGYMSVLGPVKAGLMYGAGRNVTNNKLKGYISIGFRF